MNHTYLKNINTISLAATIAIAFFTIFFVFEKQTRSNSNDYIIKSGVKNVPKAGCPLGTALSDNECVIPMQPIKYPESDNSNSYKEQSLDKSAPFPTQAVTLLWPPNGAILKTDGSVASVSNK